MNSFYVDIVFLCNLDKLIDVVFIDSKFALRTSCNNVIRSSRSHFGIDSHKDIFSSEFIFMNLKSLQSSYIKSYSCLQGIVKLFSRDEILGIHYFVRFVSAWKGFVNLAWWDYINAFYSQFPDEFNNRRVSICLESISNIEPMCCLKQPFDLISQYLLAVDVKRGFVFVDKVGSFGRVTNISDWVFFHCGWYIQIIIRVLLFIRFDSS